MDSNITISRKIIGKFDSAIQFIFLLILIFLVGSALHPHPMMYLATSLLIGMLMGMRLSEVIILENEDDTI